MYSELEPINLDDVEDFDASHHHWKTDAVLREVGTAASGDRGHAGRPGVRGGSAPGQTSQAKDTPKKRGYESAEQERRGMIQAYADLHYRLDTAYLDDKQNVRFKSMDLENPEMQPYIKQAEEWAAKIEAGDPATMQRTIAEYKDDGIKKFSDKPNDFVRASLVSEPMMLWALSQQPYAQAHDYVANNPVLTMFAEDIGMPARQPAFDSPRAEAVLARELGSSTFMPTSINVFDSMQHYENTAFNAKTDDAFKANALAYVTAGGTVVAFNNDPKMWRDEERLPQSDPNAAQAPYTTNTYGEPGHRFEWAMTHEMGHVLHDSMSAGKQKEWYAIAKDYMDAQSHVVERVARVSDYSLKNDNELFAESYSAYRHHLGGLLSPDIRSFFKDRLKVSELPADFTEADYKATVHFLDKPPAGVTYHCHMLDRPRLSEAGTAASGDPHTSIREVGTAASGDRGHLGRKGQRGGSLPYAAGVPASRLTQKALRESIKQVFNESTPEEVVAGKRWYEDAHDFAQELATKYHVTIQQAAGVIAAMSPQLRWDGGKLNNKAAAELMFADREHAMDSPYMNRSIQMAQKIIDGGDPMQVMGGPKTQNFYQNILDPQNPEPVTIDRHAIHVAAGPMSKDQDKSLLGTDYRYNYFKQAYTDAAKELNLIPNDLQAIVWTHWYNTHRFERKRKAESEPDVYETEYGQYIAHLTETEYAGGKMQWAPGLPDWLQPYIDDPDYSEFFDGGS